MRSTGTAPQVHERLVLCDVLPEWAIHALSPIQQLNCIQSAAFETTFHQNDNFTLAAPSGTGKQLVALLAMLRLLHIGLKPARVVYVVPHAAAARLLHRRLQRRFGPLGASVMVGAAPGLLCTRARVWLPHSLPFSRSLPDVGPNHLEERLLDQAQARAAYATPFWRSFAQHAPMADIGCWETK